jgi:hypothetical protein
MPNSNSKGKRGEREVAELLRSNGFNARRGQQFAGGHSSPDVVHDLPGIHFEVKRSETLRLYAALEQAQRDAKDDEVGVVIHRQNSKPWIVVLDAEAFLRIVGQHTTASDIS